MKKTIIWVLVLLSLIALLLQFSDKITETFLGIKKTSGISILSEPQEASVFLNNAEVGKTPYENKNLDVKDYTVRLEKEGLSWQGKITLTPGTITVVNRSLAAEVASSAGEILTLDKGKGLTIISNPSGADIEIDGKPSGKTPTTVDISIGEHTIFLSHTNYLKRSIRANLPANFNLTLSADLALSEADLTNIATPVVTQTPEVIVRDTPTGFLRVRDKAGLNGKEIVQVKPGDKLVLLEEQGSWYKVRLPDGIAGFVSSSYVEKQDP